MQLHDFKETGKNGNEEEYRKQKMAFSTWKEKRKMKKEIKEKVVNTNRKELKYVQISLSP